MPSHISAKHQSTSVDLHRRRGDPWCRFCSLLCPIQWLSTGRQQIFSKIRLLAPNHQFTRGGVIPGEISFHNHVCTGKFTQTGVTLTVFYSISVWYSIYFNPQEPGESSWKSTGNLQYSPCPCTAFLLDTPCSSPIVAAAFSVPTSLLPQHAPLSCQLPPHLLSSGGPSGSNKLGHNVLHTSTWTRTPPSPFPVQLYRLSKLNIMCDA